MSIVEGVSVEVVNMSQGLNEEHVHSTFIATAAVSNNILVKSNKAWKK